MAFEIRVSAAFAASHQLRLPDGSLEPHHGHGWSVEVTLVADQLDAMDCVIDFHIVQRKLAAIIGPWDRRHLNDVEPFSTGTNPSAERVAEAIARRLSFEEDVRLASVAVGEATGCVAVYRP
jgi:6-pyruvoyltetrahydropterin/6-carboxytetrahydropterin synthase